MNHEVKDRLIAHLRSLPGGDTPITDGGDLMRRWFRQVTNPHFCGTVGCILGELALMNGFRPDFDLKLMNRMDQHEVGLSEAADTLGVARFDPLFEQDRWPPFLSTKFDQATTFAEQREVMIEALEYRAHTTSYHFEFGK